MKISREEALLRYMTRIESVSDRQPDEIESMIDEVIEACSMPTLEGAGKYLERLGWGDTMYCARALRGDKMDSPHMVIRAIASKYQMSNEDRDTLLCFIKDD